MTRAAALSLLLLLAATGAADGEDVRAELRAICDAHLRGDDPYFGRGRIAELRRLLEHPEISPVDAAKVRGQLGRWLLRLGDVPEAIATFEAALQSEGLPAALVRQLRRDLALAHLTRAEDENCVSAHSPASCILPFAREAVHRRAEHTRRAAELYAAYLGESPFDLQVRWLYNLARLVAGDAREDIPEAWRLPADALTAEAPMPRWTNVAGELGVASFDLSGGAIMEDFDGDGLLDLVSSTWDPCGSMKAFLNDGRGGFVDVTAAWGLDAQLGGLNLMPADFDNDGRVDVLVLRGAWRGRWGEVRNSLLRNEPGGFVDVTRRAGLDGAFPTQAAAWGDYDGDGDLDLYVGAEAEPERPYPSRLYRNDGRGEDGGVTFTDVTREAGVANLRFAKAAAWGDVDGDGDLDLYVSNFGPNRLYRNDGGRFRDVAAAAGVVEPAGPSFASWFFDWDNDGDLDLLVADYGTEYKWVSGSYLGVPTTGGHPRLYVNDGTGRFTDVSSAVGFKRPLLPMGSNYGDLENDGYLDVYFGTGIPNLESLMPNVMYKNDGGRRFLDVTFSGGFGQLQKGHGVAFGDLDNDGDQDLFQQLGGAYPVDAYFNALYENPTCDVGGCPEGHAFVTLRLEGKKANRFGVGARIAVRVRRGEERRSVHVLAGTGGSFGASSLQQEIGLGDAEAIEEVVILWPGSGTVDRHAGVELNRVYRAVEGAAELVLVEVRPFELGGSGRDQ